MPTKPTKKTTNTKTKTATINAPHAAAAKLDLFNLAEVIQGIADRVLHEIDLDNLTSNVKQNLGHLRTIADALAAQVIAQHGTDADRQKVVERLKDRFFS